MGKAERDQELRGANQAMLLNIKHNLPVRVLRGRRHVKPKKGAQYSPFAPPLYCGIPGCYRYDGLYRVRPQPFPRRRKGGLRLTPREHALSPAGHLPPFHGQPGEPRASSGAVPPRAHRPGARAVDRAREARSVAWRRDDH